MAQAMLVAFLLLSMGSLVLAFELIIRTPPKDVIRPVIARFPPAHSPIYKRKEYILKVWALVLVQALVLLHPSPERPTPE